LKAWESKIYPDHGWGGKDGQSTDDIFLAKFAFAKEEGKSLLNEAMRNIASNIVMNREKGIPVVVFNSLSWKRTGPVTFTIQTISKSHSVGIYSADGKQIPSQISDVLLDKNGYLRKASITFIANEVPSIGYATYFVKAIEGTIGSRKLEFSDAYDNQFYQIHFGKGGIDKLTDKSSKKELLSDNGLNAGEIFTLQSEGNGAGEFDAIQEPTIEGFDKISNYETKWNKIEDGAICAVFKYRQSIRDAVIEQCIKVYKTIKRIDFNVALKNWDGTLYREYRMALPLNISDAKISYEVPFGVVEIGKDELKKPAGQIYQTIPKNIHPRGLENWMNASGKNFGVTLSSSVAAFDFVDITGHFPNSTLLQPILLASRKSCNSEGNKYLQTGDHYYSFSLTSDNPGWENGFQFGREANELLKAVVNPAQTIDAMLPEKESFVSVNKKNVIITTFKKAEDDDGIILRFYEIEGKDTDLEFLFNKPIRKAFTTSLIEQTSNEIPSSGNILKFNIKHNSIETIKIYFK
jgi:alpha-mannosidase